MKVETFVSDPNFSPICKHSTILPHKMKFSQGLSPCITGSVPMYFGVCPHVFFRGDRPRKSVVAGTLSVIFSLMNHSRSYRIKFDITDTITEIFAAFDYTGVFRQTPPPERSATAASRTDPKQSFSAPKWQSPSELYSHTLRLRRLHAPAA